MFLVNDDTQHFPQEEAWAAVKRGRGGKEVAVGTRCQACANTVCQAYPHMSWDEAISRARTSTLFRDELFSAKQILQGGDRKFIPEALLDRASTSLSLQRCLLFVTAGDFEKEHGVKPQQVPGLELIELQDECGQTLKGIVMVNPNKPHRELIVSTAATMVVEKQLLEPRAQLRAGQAVDMAEWLRSQRGKTDPAVHGCSSARSAEEVAKLVAIVKKAKERNTEEEAKRDKEPLLAPLQSAEADALERRKQDGSDKDAAAAEADDIDESSVGAEQVVERVQPGFAAQFAAAAQAKANASRGRGQSRGGRSRGASTAPGRGRGAGASQEEGSKRAKTIRGSVAESLAGGSQYAGDGKSVAKSKGGLSNKEKALSQARSKYAALDPGLPLAGDTMKAPLYHARRALSTLVEQKLKDSVEHSNLKARIELTEECVALYNSLEGMGKDERHKAMSSISSSVQELPPEFQLMWLEAAVKDLDFKSGKDVDLFLAMLKPNFKCREGDTSTQLLWGS